MTTETGAPNNRGELFIDWKTNPIADQIKKRLKNKGFDIPGMIASYHIPEGTQEYTDLSRFLGKILDYLPFNNEVGSTILMRDDAPRVVRSLSDVFHGRKTWADAQDIFNGETEIFKNEVYAFHNIPSAICYNVDLSTQIHFPESNGAIIQRIHIVNENGTIRGEYDGDFDINLNRIIVTADNFSLPRVHTR